MRIELQKFGDILISRPAGREAYLAMSAYVTKDMQKGGEIIIDFVRNLLSSQRAEIKKMVEGMSTPAIANQEEIECCNCGEDLALESYDWLDEGYKMAITDVLSALEK